MPDFTEVAPRVWVAHYDWMHVNITLIGGSDGLLMVDTHGSAAQARDRGRRRTTPGRGSAHRPGQHPRALGPPLRQRHHGRAVRRDAGPRHRSGRPTTWRSPPAARSRCTRPATSPRRDEILATTLHLPDRTFSSAVQVDLGDRARGADPPRTRAHRGRSRRPRPGRGRDARGRPDRGVRPAVHRRRLVADGVADDPRLRDQPDDRPHRRRPRPRSGRRSRLRPGPARRARGHCGDASATSRPAASRSPRRSHRATGRGTRSGS